VFRDDEKKRNGMEQKGQKYHIMLAVAKGMLQGTPISHSEKLSDHQLV
jgi:hypothetical protein